MGGYHGSSEWWLCFYRSSLLLSAEVWVGMWFWEIFQIVIIKLTLYVNLVGTDVLPNDHMVW
uniref:Uncharacterized protein n=1 Tax=Nelumbo nucifera TaxID=4432 RepID=A0A822YP15_NELNU|nr:TPA_asm: hypothetical protein HUJ06_009859 [Nelumbo nucifera]